MNQYVRATKSDPDAPHVSDTQKYLVLQPIGRRLTDIPFFFCHGATSAAGTPFAVVPDNDPNWPNQMVSHGEEKFGAIASQVTFISHDLQFVDGATMNRNGFGAKAITDIIEAMRLKMGSEACRTDRMIVAGTSMGSGTAALYTLLYPERVAACVLLMPGGDTETARFGANAASINKAWGFASPYNQIYSVSRGVGGATYRSGGPAGQLAPAWQSGLAYLVNDTVIPDAASPLVGGIWRCIRAHTSTGTTLPYTDATTWQQIDVTDPLQYHYSIPSEGGTSLAFAAGTPLAGLAASILEPANLTRMRQITSGTLPSLNGRKVPILMMASHGDIIAMATGSNGVQTGIAEWWAAQVGATMVVISDSINHSADEGAIQPIDPNWAQIGNLAVGASLASKIGGNQTMVIRLPAGTWTGTVVFEATTDSAGATGWVGVNAHTTFDVLANSTKEGPDVPSTTAPGTYRSDGGGYRWLRIRRSTGTGTIVGAQIGPSYSSEEQVSYMRSDLILDLVKQVEAVFTVNDLGSGSFQVAGSQVTKNVDRTATINDPSVVVNGDGSYTLTTT